MRYARRREDILIGGEYWQTITDACTKDELHTAVKTLSKAKARWRWIADKKGKNKWRVAILAEEAAQIETKNNKIRGPLKKCPR